MSKVQFLCLFDHKILSDYTLKKLINEIEKYRIKIIR